MPQRILQRRGDRERRQRAVEAVALAGLDQQFEFGRRPKSEIVMMTTLELAFLALR